jgi:hypothetical protein
MIDVMLYSYGCVSQSMLILWFNTSSATTTRDMAIYRKECPDNTYFDNTTKMWHKAAGYVSKF